MLTQEQIEKLELLTKHPRFGQILQDAMSNWIQPNINPVHGDFGVIYSNDRFILEKDCCCLIGSFILGKKNLNPLEEEETLRCELAGQYLDISYWEITAIVDGFDQRMLKFNASFPEAYDFGKQVSLILFGDLNA